MRDAITLSIALSLSLSSSPSLSLSSSCVFSPPSLLSPLHAVLSHFLSRFRAVYVFAVLVFARFILLSLPNVKQNKNIFLVLSGSPCPPSSFNCFILLLLFLLLLPIEMHLAQTTKYAA